MKENIVVMGGSFNPPTIAHLVLMTAAMDAVDASRGIFVPTSNSYVAKKMKKLHTPEDVLGEFLRMEMLRSMCANDPRLEMSSIRLSDSDVSMKRTEIVYDIEMMESLQEEYPESRILLLVGSDKLYILPRWHRINDLIEKFGILVALRGEDDLVQIKAARPYLAEHWDAFTVFNVPPEITSISSSLFREKLNNGDESAMEIVTPEVWNMMNEAGKIPWNSITNFHEEQYKFLSNFYPADIHYGGLDYKNNEAAFQAQKCMTEDEKIPFTVLEPGKSKGLGRRVQLRPDWEEVKTSIMEEIVQAKFEQHPELSDLLLETGEKILIEGNRWGDTF